MSKLPYMQFYPADWLSDPDLLLCSLESQGLWIRLICLMWKSETRGKLKGTWENLARQSGIPEKVFIKNVRELASNKVIGFRESDTIKTLFSRRLIREEKFRNNKNLRNKKYYDKTNSDAVRTKLSIN